jgi:hypothetical protein
MKTRITPRLMAEIAAILDDDDRSTPMTRPDLDDWTEGRFPRRITSQHDIDHPCDRRERDGEAFDVPIRFGDGMRWGGHTRQPRDWPETLGSILGAAIVIGVAAFLAWMAARGMGAVRWR